MMPDATARRGPATAAPRPTSSTHRRGRVHTPTHTVHTIHTAVPGIPGSAAPRVDEAARPARLVHTGPDRVHTVRVLVWIARWVAPPAGGALLISAGVYVGPWSLVPVPVVLALAAVGHAVPTAPAGGVR